MGPKGLGKGFVRIFKNTLKGVKMVGRAQGLQDQGRRMADEQNKGKGAQPFSSP